MLSLDKIVGILSDEDFDYSQLTETELTLLRARLQRRIREIEFIFIGPDPIEASSENDHELRPAEIPEDWAAGEHESKKIFPPE